MSILIRSAKVIDPSSPYHLDTVDIFIENGSIAQIGNSLSVGADTLIETDGLHISKGWIDCFADYREPGFEQHEDIRSGLNAAAAGGFTSTFIVPNTQPSISSKSVVQYVQTRAEGHTCKLYPIGSISHNLEGKSLAEMLEMQQYGAIAFSDGWNPVQNANLMLKALEYVKAFGGILIQIPMDTTLSSGGLMHEGEESTRLGMPGVPGLAETVLLYRDIELLRYTGSRLHVTGISSAEGVELIRKAKAEGLAISCSVSPYHLYYNDSVMQSYRSVYKTFPPIRSEQDRQALLTGVQDGTIDCIASHHRPQDWDAKAKEFEYAAPGMNIQEISFNIAYEVLKRTCSLEKIIALFSDHPAKIFNLPQKPIKEGEIADYTLFAPEQSVRLHKVHSKSANNTFTGEQLPARVLGIIHKDRHTLNI